MTTTPTDGPPGTPRPWLALLAVLPALGFGVATSVMLLLGAVDRHPMWRVERLNLSEAAGARDAATVVWLIENGENPDLERTVRVGVVDNRAPVQFTPLEAAVEARRVEIVDLLLRHGAVLDRAERARFLCRAQARGDEDLVRYFEARGGAVTCEDVAE